MSSVVRAPGPGPAGLRGESAAAAAAAALVSARSACSHGEQARRPVRRRAARRRRRAPRAAGGSGAPERGARSAAARCSDCSFRSVASRKADLGVGQGGVLPALPLQRLGRPDPAVELAVGTAHRVPGVGSPASGGAGSVDPRRRRRARHAAAARLGPAPRARSRRCRRRWSPAGMRRAGRSGARGPGPRRADVGAPGCGPAHPRPRRSPAAAPDRAAAGDVADRCSRRPSPQTARPRRGCRRWRRTPATVSVLPSRRFHVSRRACESIGSAPGVPSTSPTSRSTSPASISRPACRAGAWTASRRPCSLIAPSRCRPRSSNRANPG